MIAIPRNTVSTRSGNAAAAGTIDRLCLAAAPTFAVMAAFSAAGGGAPDICSAAHGASPLTGMAAMYVLMSVFHAAPWLKLIACWRNGGLRP